MVTVQGIGAASDDQVKPVTREVALTGGLAAASFLQVTKVGNLVQFNIRIGSQTRIANGTQIAQLPEGFRPMGQTILSANEGGMEYCILNLQPDGRVLVTGGLAYGTSYAVYYTFNEFYITDEA